MVVLQLFNREERAYDKFSDVNAIHMDAYKDAIMAHAVYYPVVEILSSIAIACVIWFGGNDVIRGATVSSVTASFSRQTLLSFPRGSHRSEHWRADRVHSIRATIFQADSGLQREVQYPAVGDGRQRARFQTAGQPGGNHFAGDHQVADRTGTD